MARLLGLGLDWAVTKSSAAAILMPRSSLCYIYLKLGKLHLKSSQSRPTLSPDGGGDGGWLCCDLIVKILPVLQFAETQY